MDLSSLSLDNLNLSLGLDIIVGLVLLFSVGIAFLRGFVREVLTITGLIGGIFCALLFGGALEPSIAGMLGVSSEKAEKLISPIPNDFLVKAISYGGIFISVVIGLSIVSYFISKKLKDTGMGPIDRTLGVFFGLARAVLVLGFLYLPLYLMMSSEKREELFDKSISHVYVEWSAAGVKTLLPENLLPQKKSDEDKSDLANFTREKLKEIDVLKSTAPKALDKDAGYNDTSRDDLDALIAREGGTFNE
ncbi:MAG: hypothetical protein CL561_07715 [Alphaproteobacteria bacterium]|nr:hypothetical protein [Alphaproteobacteria bacterium]|tara:strand:- start:201 stop:944 length:744 start_codon:yes stop_codon:yes gene_type:complete